MSAKTMRLGDLEIEVNGSPSPCVAFRGKSNLREPEAVLQPFFAEILGKVVTPGGAIELHFEDLQFFNSSTITAVIHFIKDLRSGQVATRVIYDSSHKSQKVFFDALGTLKKSDGLLQITPVSR